MHKDLSDQMRDEVARNAGWLAVYVSNNQQSLAIAREAWIEVFDREAARLDGAD